MQSMIDLLVGAIWFILPAYVANSVPVDVSKISFLKKYGKPIDGGKTWRNKRILGDGKTWRGLFSGVFAGTLVGAVETALEPSVRATYPFLPEMTLSIAFMLSLGALLGDMAASFIKRRIELEPGQPAPLLDQLDFLAGAILLAWIWTAIQQGTFANALEGMIGYPRLALIIIITPFVHLLGNFIAWMWRLKKNPW